VWFVAGDAEIEDRIRELLRDPGWSMPTWPDPQGRVRRAARRQQRRAAGAAASCAAITAAVIVGALSAFQPGTQAGPDAVPVADALPAVGAPGFPVALYPPASQQAAILFGRCPNPAGVKVPAPSMQAQTTAVVTTLGTSFQSDLHDSDRADWPQIQSAWRSGISKVSAAADVLYSGPLESQRAIAYGSSGLSRSVRAACGSATARDSWLVVTRRGGRHGQQSEYLLLDRRGRVLVWNVS
jgi:hypothetical protein